MSTIKEPFDMTRGTKVVYIWIVIVLLVVIGCAMYTFSANEAYVSAANAGGVCSTQWKRCYPKNYNFSNMGDLIDMDDFMKMYTTHNPFYIASMNETPPEYEQELFPTWAPDANPTPTPSVSPVSLSNANGVCHKTWRKCYPKNYDFAQMMGGENVDMSSFQKTYGDEDVFYIARIEDTPYKFKRVMTPTAGPTVQPVTTTSPTVPPAATAAPTVTPVITAARVVTTPTENTHLTAAPGQSTFNFAACHDGLKKCYQKDYDFTREFGANATNLDEMVKSEQAKKKSVRYFNIPADYAYVHKKGTLINGFIHSDPNWNRVMVCDVEKKKCYDRTANLKEDGYDASTIDEMIEKEKKKGRNMWDYTIPRKFKYYK